jgi:hypothetical protein
VVSSSGATGGLTGSSAEITAAFAHGWQIDSLEPATIDVTSEPNGIRAWLLAATRMDEPPAQTSSMPRCCTTPHTGVNVWMTALLCAVFVLLAHRRRQQIKGLAAAIRRQPGARAAASTMRTDDPPLS